MDEVPSLACGVSLLVNFEPAKDYLDWQVGTHGIHIFFSQNGKRMSSVYLPEVAFEQGWDQRQTMDELMKKGGFRGPISEDDRRAARIERFRSEKLTITYQVRNC